MQKEVIMADILGVTGSPRPGGNSERLLEAMLAAARDAGASTATAKLRQYQFSSCIGCEACRKDKRCTGLKDGMGLIYPEIDASRGLVLVSPVHNYNVSAIMKAFIDRLYCYYDFNDERPRGWSSRLAGQGRKAVVVAIGEQEERRDMGFTLEAMRMPLEALGYEEVKELPVLGVFDAGRVRQREEVMAQAEELGRWLAGAL